MNRRKLSPFTNPEQLEVAADTCDKMYGTFLERTPPAIAEIFDSTDVVVKR